MTNILFNIEYCIIDLSDYDIKIEKNIKNSSKSGSGIFMPGYWIVIYQNMILQRHGMVL